jgi:hypothetical protein
MILRSLFVLVLASLVFTGTAFARSEPLQEVVVDLSCEPAEAEIGQPVTWILIVEHPHAGVVSLQGAEETLTADPEADRLWVELADRRRSITQVGEARTRTTFAWTVCALDSGTHTLEGLRVEVDLPERVVSRAVEGATLFVRGALGDGEDAPRPLEGFRPLPDTVSAGGRLFLLVFGGLLVLAILVFVWIARLGRRRPALMPTSRGPLEELAALSAGLTDEPGAGAELGYALSHLLRREVDATTRAPHVAVTAGSTNAATDIEWATSIEADPGLPESLRFGIARLVRDLEPLKYGGSTPTRFALQELLDRARDPLVELERLSAPAALSTKAGAKTKGAA